MAKLLADRADGRIGREEFRRQALALNRRILSYNLQAPSVAVHKLQVKVE
jgi:hypothetical protein